MNGARDLLKQVSPFVMSVRPFAGDYLCATRVNFSLHPDLRIIGNHPPASIKTIFAIVVCY